MRLNRSEQRELSQGRYIMRRFRLKSSGEVIDVEVKRSWDKFYYRYQDGPWCASVTSAHWSVVDAVESPFHRPELEDTQPGFYDIAGRRNV